VKRCLDILKKVTTIKGEVNLKVNKSIINKGRL